MVTHNIPQNTSLEELLNAIELDPKATEREKFLVEYFRINRGNFGWHPAHPRG